MIRALPVVALDLLDRVRLNDTETGWRVGETEHDYIEVFQMLYNDRIMVIPKNAPKTADRYWCYRQGPAAVLAALAWDGSRDTEPVGWIKSWDGRYSEEFRREHRMDQFDRR